MNDSYPPEQCGSELMRVVHPAGTKTYHCELLAGHLGTCLGVADGEPLEAPDWLEVK